MDFSSQIISSVEKQTNRQRVGRAGLKNVEVNQSPRLTSATTANYTAVSVAGEGDIVSEGPEGPSASGPTVLPFVSRRYFCAYFSNVFHRKLFCCEETRGHYSH